MEIAGKKVLLTGATGGLGRTIANTIADAGGKLVLSGRSAEALEEMAGTLPGTGHSFLAADLGQPGAAQKLAAEAEPVDVLVANAALPSTGRITELTDEQVARMLRINLEAPILLAQALLPGMLERGQGHLVMIGSLAGKAGSPRSSIYNASKFGLRGFVFGMAADLADTPVGASIVAPGFVRDAGMFADTGVEAPPGLGTTTPEKVAEAVLRAVASNRIEITVAPLVQRTMVHVGLISPHLSHRVQSGRGVTKGADLLASRQTDKR